MDRNEELLEKLLAAFASETQERLQEITDSLLELEKEPAGPRREVLLETIYRDAHSLKGAARSVDRTDVEAACQALEEVFARWKRGELEPDPGMFDALHRAVERLGELSSTPGGSRGEEVVRLIDRLLLPDGTRAKKKPPGKTLERRAVSGTDAPRRDLPATGEAVSVKTAREETVRVSLGKLETLVRQAEEMLAVKLTTAQRANDLRSLHSGFDLWQKRWSRIQPELEGRSAALRGFLAWQKGHLQSIEARLPSLLKSAEEDAGGFGRRVDQLLENSKKILLFPFASILQPFAKMVRDVSREQGKEAELIVRGADLEIDRRILDEIKDPLTHLVRNGLDHAIEKPADRERAGKPRRGTITIAVSQVESDKMQIEVRDDGAGIDLQQVQESAVHKGVISREEASRLDERQVLQLIFQSGVSTSPSVTTISGRGLGLAIVREKAESLGGQVRLETAAARGSTFCILLPLSLATFRGVLVQAADRCFVIPTAGVERVGRVRREEVRTVENRETIPYRGGTLPLVRLAQVLELPVGGGGEPDPIPFLVLGSGSARIAFSVDEILCEQEVLQKSLNRQLARVRNIGGATVLGDGRVVPILNVSDLLKSAVKVGASSNPGATGRAKQEEEKKKKTRNVLVVEDSITARILLKSILESAGYAVRTAVDGIDALTELKTEQCHLVVSDVEMPRMDGFELTARIRGDDRLRELPVILVTARGRREDRERGIDAGANAYIVKSSFEQSSLLEAVRRLIP